MATRVVEGKKPYTGGKAIDIDENKVISLRLREENNLIIWDEGDNEIYVDLQLPDGIEPLDAFPVGVNVGRVLIADDWDVNGTLVVFKTTSGDNIKLLYGDDGKLYIDNGTGLFKQIYLKGEVDALLQALRDYVDAQLALKQDILIAGEYIEIEDNVISAVIPTMSRFLSIWNASSGEPISFPASIPFTYTTGDYYLIEGVGASTNYRPAPVEYDGTASQIPEPDTEVADGDVYIYDGTVWLLQENHNKTVAFANIAGDPYDNTNLSTALNAKANTTDVLTKTNTSSYTPSGNYNPATKKYVDDGLSNKQATLVNQSNIKSINNNSLLGSGNLSISEVPSGGTNGQVLTQTQNGPAWQNAQGGGSDIEYVTSAEYTALLPGAASDGKHYFIFQGTPVTGVTLNESSISLTTVGDTYQLTATVSPNDAYDKSVTWSSSDQNVATVDNTGLVTCVTPGNCTITVTTTDGGFTATCGVDAGGWIPGANTIAYFPLDTDLLDHSGNSFAITKHGNVSIGTVGGVSAGYFGGLGDLVGSYSYNNTSLTALGWIYKTANPNNDNASIFGYGIDNLGGGQPGLWYYNTNGAGWASNKPGVVVADSDTSMSVSCVPMNNNQWYHFAFTYDVNTSKVTLYVNGAYAYDYTETMSRIPNMLGMSRKYDMDRSWKGYMSNVIFEDKCWTAQEISDYFDLTKGDYGIS